MAETNKSGANPNSFPTLCDVMQGLLQRDAECAARWQVEKHLPRLPCSDGLPDGGCVDGAAKLIAPSTLPLARGACGGTQRGR